MKTNTKSKTVQDSRLNQHGLAAVIGIIIVVIILLVAGVVAYVIMTQKQGPVLELQNTEVTADDRLSQGKTTNELIIDRSIIAAGINRDDEQAKATLKVLDDQQLPVGDGVTASTVVESTRLSSLQTEFIAETDRRLNNLQDANDLSEKLLTEQRTQTQKVINDETTTLTGLKAKTAAETTKEGFLADRNELDAEYTNYLMAITQVNLLIWANDQTSLTEKINVLGGKFQERLNDASNSGESIAVAQTQLNSYQSDKTSAVDNTAKALKSVNEVMPSTFNANKAVLHTYYDQLNSAHIQLAKTLDSSKLIVLEIKAYKQ